MYLPRQIEQRSTLRVIVTITCLKKVKHHLRDRPPSPFFCGHFHSFDDQMDLWHQQMRRSRASNARPPASEIFWHQRNQRSSALKSSWFKKESTPRILQNRFVKATSRHVSAQQCDLLSMYSFKRSSWRFILPLTALGSRGAAAR